MPSYSTLVQEKIPESSVLRPVPDGIPQSLLCRLFRVQQFNDIHERAAELHLHLPLGKKRLKRLECIRSAVHCLFMFPKMAEHPSVTSFTAVP